MVYLLQICSRIEDFLTQKLLILLVNPQLTHLAVNSIIVKVHCHGISAGLETVRLSVSHVLGLYLGTGRTRTPAPTSAETGAENLGSTFVGLRAADRPSRPTVLQRSCPPRGTSAVPRNHTFLERVPAGMMSPS